VEALTATSSVVSIGGQHRGAAAGARGGRNRTRTCDGMNA